MSNAEADYAYSSASLLCRECGWQLYPCPELAEVKPGTIFHLILQCRNPLCSKVGILYEVLPESAVKLKLYVPEVPCVRSGNKVGDQS